jgi:pimeloyl-ACP methyl ester carboxylesterase
MLFKKILLKKYKSVLFSRKNPDTAVKQFDYSDFTGLKREKFPLESVHGKINAQLYYYDGYDTERLVIFEHGMGTGHRAYMREIEKICSLGFKVFAYDHIGTGLSGGEYVRGLSGSLCDLDFVIAEIKKAEQFKGLKLDLIGHSWGGFSSMTISAFHPEIEHIVALSGFISVYDMICQITPRILRGFVGSLYALEKSVNPEYATVNALDALENTKSKVLIIHSKDDKTVNYNLHFSRLLDEFKDKSNITLVSLENKNHNPTYTSSAVKYKENFFISLKRYKKSRLPKTEETDEKFKSSFDFYKMTEQDDEVYKLISDFLKN